LFAFSANQPDFRRIDFFIEAMRLVQSDGKTPATKYRKTKPCFLALRLLSEAARSG
jgi:hypothetical protein